jgi:hypothetical protein
MQSTFERASSAKWSRDWKKRRLVEHVLIYNQKRETTMEGASLFQSRPLVGVFELSRI